MKRLSIGIFVGLVLESLLTGSTFIRNAQVTGSSEGYVVTIFGHDFTYR